MSQNWWKKIGSICQFLLQSWDDGDNNNYNDGDDDDDDD